MSRIVPVHYRKVVQVLESEGFTFARERGDHLIFNKPGIKRAVVLPRYNPLPVFIIVNVLRTAGISRERYLELLGQE
jgi:predicted RNA binding protein YcfA (HicA-like mRNA interferase family)